MSETEDAFLRRRRKFGLGVACALGGVGLGLTLVAVPFVLPALRRYCLPYVPATPEHIEYVLLQLKGRTGKVVDLGSGDGRLVIAAAKQGHQAVGFELNPWLVLYSRWRAFRSGVHRLAKFRRRDLWKVNFSEYENIIFFGVDQMMEPLAEKIAREALPTARVIAWTPTAKIPMGPTTNSNLGQLSSK